MNEQMHALAYFAGANSIFYGEKLLTTPNPQAIKDMTLFSRLGIRPEQRQVSEPPAIPTPQFYDATAAQGAEAHSRLQAAH
jgi:biotin synthase